MHQRIRTLPWLAAITALLAAFAASAAFTAAKAHALDPVTGRRRALVIVVQWDEYENIGASTPLHTGEEIADAMDDVVTPWYASVSRGQFLGWDTDFTGPYTIDPRDTSYPNARCAEFDPRTAIAVRARAAASNDGFDMDDYDHIVIYNQKPENCPWSSAGDRPGQHSWLRSFETDTLIHELGHNLGLNHSHALRCADENGRQVTLNDHCATIAYGDRYSAMADDLFSFAASQQWALGWMGQRKLDLTLGAQPAHLYLQPLESTGLTIQAVRVQDADATYWVEYRASLGVDTTPPGGPERTGVVIRQQGPNDPTRSFLLDMTPSGGFYFGDADLPAGQSWTNPLGNLTFTVNSIGPLGAELTIERRDTLVTVPNVLGLDRGTATRAITGAGLTLGTVSSKVDQTCSYIDTVMDQTPGGGFQRAPGSTVAITIGTRPSGGCG